MRSKTVRELLIALAYPPATRGARANDNPFSEAQLKTLKYQPTIGKRSMASTRPGVGREPFSAGTMKNTITPVWP